MRTVSRAPGFCGSSSLCSTSVAMSKACWIETAFWKLAAPMTCSRSFWLALSWDTFPLQSCFFGSPPSTLSASSRRAAMSKCCRLPVYERKTNAMNLGLSGIASSIARLSFSLMHACPHPTRNSRSPSTEHICEHGHRILVDTTPSYVPVWPTTSAAKRRDLPRQPWHDVHAKLDGPAAWDYLREFVGRWLTISGSSAKDDAIWKAYLALLDRTKVWPPEEPLPDGIWTVQVCRSLEKAHWTVDLPKRTIEDLTRGQHWSEAYRFNWRVAGADCEQSILQPYRRGTDVAEEQMCLPDSPYTSAKKAKEKGWGWNGDFQLLIPRPLVRSLRRQVVPIVATIEAGHRPLLPTSTAVL